MKKLLSTLLALVMVLSAMSMIAMADEAAPFQYPAYEKPEDYPTSSPGPGLAAVVILKPDADLTDYNNENSGKYSRIRFIFTPEHGIPNGYMAGWGIGSMLEDGSTAFYMPDIGHYLADKYNGGSGHFQLGIDDNGYWYWEVIWVLPPNENGKWEDEEGTEYDTMYDMAANDKLLAIMCEADASDPQGQGFHNGLINSDPSRCMLNWFGTSGNPWNGLDGITVRITTEEDYYKDGDRNTKLPNESYNTMGALVVHVTDGSVYATDKELYVCKASFVFKGWKNNPDKNGYEAGWGITLLPQDSNGTYKYLPRPEFADGYTWYNCGNDDNVIAPDGTEINTNWDQFSWFEDKNGDTVFQVTFAMPASVLKAAGYDSLEQAAAVGAVIGCVYEHKATELDGVIDCGFEGQANMKANAKLSDGRDAIIVGGVSGVEYYGETPYIPETTPATTVAPETTPSTTAPSTTAPSTTAPVTGEAAGTETDAPAEESGCASSIGMAVLAIAALAAAPIAFARKKH